MEDIFIIKIIGLLTLSRGNTIRIMKNSIRGMLSKVEMRLIIDKRI